MPGMSVTPALMLATMSRSGATILRISIRERFIWKSSPSCASVGVLRISSSSASILSSNLDRTGKKLSTSEPMTRYTMTSWGEATWATGWRSSRSRVLARVGHSPRCTVTT